MSRHFVYVGTYTREGGRGIVVLELCAASGRILREVQQIDVEDPAYLALHPTRDVLYCVNEVRSLAGAPTGGVCEFERDPISGRLHFRCQWPSGGMTPAHVAVDPTGRWLAVANYRGANVALGRLDEAGHLRELTPRWQFSGCSVHRERQLQPHPHQTVFHGEGVIVPALGADEILWRALAGDAVVATKLPAGAGPRHLAVARDGAACYVLCELSSQLAVFAMPARREPMQLQAILSLRDRRAGVSQAGAIKLHPSGRFLFCSNRGDDTVAVFSVATSGAVERVQVASSGGRWPRDLTLTPDGRWLVVANQHSGDLSVFAFDAAGGRLGERGDRWPVIAPACVAIR